MTETHLLIYRAYKIRVKVAKQAGFWYAHSYIVYKKGVAINHKLSPKAETTINDILSDYCEYLNQGIS